MAETTVRRHLAAILAADVVGFSRLTEADEDRTLARLRSLRSDVIDPTISAHNGRVVKRTGDGVIVEFRSVVDAVRCAVEVQNAMIERNAGVPPEWRIEFRIGVHLGDVVEESDGDLMGDGVNIAARLEGVADPGAICLSEDAYRQVRTRLEHSVRDLGEKKLKNITTPMRVYSVTPGLTVDPVSRPDAPKPTRPPRLAGQGKVIAGLSALAVVIAVAFAFRGIWSPAPEAAYQACVEDHFATTARPSSGVFLIALTPLRGDNDRTHFNQIGRTLSRLYGEDLDSSIQIEMIDCPPILPHGGNVAQTVAIGRERGIALLKKANADVLIWGDVVRPGSQIEVRFLSPTDQFQSDFTADKVVLDADFGKAMGGLIAAKALTLTTVSSEDRGGYLVPRMERALAITAPLVADMPTGLTADQRGTILKAHADALWYIGNQSGDNAQLEAAVAAYEGALAELPRNRAPLDWAAAQNGLARALGALGANENGTARLKAALAAYQALLTEWTRERAPMDWAKAQNNLGVILVNLGIREGGTERYKAAIAAFQSALSEWTRDRAPLDWALAQSNLGWVSEQLGWREDGTDHFKAAVAAHRAALTERTRERVPLDWASSQLDIGNALVALGSRESGTQSFEAALVAFQAALSEESRETAPLAWAATQNALGNALMEIALREDGTDHIEAAIPAFQASLTGWTRERAPMSWALAQTNLGWALAERGRRKNDMDDLEAAVAAHQAALTEWTRDGAPLDWAKAQNDLGNALIEIGLRQTGTEHLEAAAAAFRAALTAWTREQVPPDWARAQNNLGFALAILGEREPGSAHLRESIAASLAALEVRTRTGAPFDWAVSQLNLGIARTALFDRTSDISQLDQAQSHLRDARAVFADVGNKHFLGMADTRLAEVADRRK